MYVLVHTEYLYIHTYLMHCNRRHRQVHRQSPYIQKRKIRRKNSETARGLVRNPRTKHPPPQDGGETILSSVRSMPAPPKTPPFHGKKSSWMNKRQTTRDQTTVSPNQVMSTTRREFAAIFMYLTRSMYVQYNVLYNTYWKDGKRGTLASIRLNIDHHVMHTPKT